MIRTTDNILLPVKTGSKPIGFARLYPWAEATRLYAPHRKKYYFGGLLTNQEKLWLIEELSNNLKRSPFIAVQN